VLSGIPAQPDDRVLIDFRTSDDAGVYRIGNGSALVQTVDFFTPIVDDPYTYGQIAAANSLSDVYAMGGRPITALAVAGFPKALVDAETIRAVFLGGFDKLREAGVALLGGHTVQDPEVKFGYAVTGLIDPAAVWSNAGARPGDVLLLTKAVGTGVIGTAIKFGRASEAVVREAVASMTRLNQHAADALRAAGGAGVHACTDITGFGLLGHASQLAAASGVTLDIDVAAVPLLQGAREMVAANRSGGLNSNLRHYGAGIAAEGIDPDVLALLYDPQTSGGLLAAVAPDRADAVERAIRQSGSPVARIGVAAGPSTVRIRVR
jgi:selenide,water dikinase